MANIVQIYLRTDDSDYDTWIDICIDMLPSHKKAELLNLLSIYNDIGQHEKTHVIFMPSEYEEMKAEDFSTYEQYAPPPNTPVVIMGRYVIITN